jgi:hypothetical protein
MVNLGQSLVKSSQTPPKPFDTHSSFGTFVVFSKFHLNTSNSLNIKVVQFVEGHNFHVEWHLKFEV